MRVDERRPFVSATVRYGLADRIVGRENITPVHLVEVQMRKAGDELGNGSASCLNFDRNGDGVLVVLNEKENRQPEVAGCVQRLPEFPLTRRAVSCRAVRDLVALGALRAVTDLENAVVAVPRFGATDCLQELGAHGTR